jgi:AcrR family transcriptional regulator
MDAAFGDKEALFRKVLDRYQEGPARYLREALNEATARRVVETMLRHAVEMCTDAHNPKGCLIVQGALACGKEAEPVRRELISRRAEGEKALRQRFARAKAAGDLPASADAADLARYITAVVHGMAIQAAGGASRAQLRGIADMAMNAFPK